MQSSIIILLSLCLTSAFGLREDFALHLWKKFKLTHGKVYESINDAHRFGIFQSNLDLIEKHNSEYSMGMHTYRLGMNQFADWTTEEFRSKMLSTRVNLKLNETQSTNTFLRLPAHMKVPDEVDWRKEGIVTPVKNQEQCGSCWAFSTTGSLEGAHARATGKLVSLSEQQLVDCSTSYGNNGCNGGLMDNAFEYIIKNGGLDTEDSYPYHAKDEKCHFNKKAIGSTCSGYTDVTSGDEDALQEALATAGPVSIAIDVTEDKFMLYKDGVFTDDECSNEPDNLNHGVLVVGYGSAALDNGKTADYWIVKNSWSTKWGESGYIRMARNLNNMCGVATTASFPLVKNDLI